MKILEKFTEQRRTEKAILIKAFLSETGKEENFWLPLSKVEIKGNIISILEEDFWKEKLNELKEPKDEKTVIVTSSAYEKGEKATKLSVQVQFNEQAFELFLFVPNSKVQDLETKKDEEGNKYFNVTMPKWVWESVYSSGIDRQLEFYNREEQKYSSNNFTLLSNVREG